MTKIFGVSASGYYRWNKRPMSKHDTFDIMLLDMIIEIHNKHKKRCGSPKITSDLKEKGMIFHSDRGVQYCSNEFRNILKDCGYEIRQSMSRKGNCWNNACAESFHSIIKRELHTLNGKYNCEEVKISIFEYIEMYYNRIRRHSTLGYLTPLQKLKTA